LPELGEEVGRESIPKRKTILVGGAKEKGKRKPLASEGRTSCESKIETIG